MLEFVTKRNQYVVNDVDLFDVREKIESLGTRVMAVMADGTTREVQIEPSVQIGEFTLFRTHSGELYLAHFGGESMHVINEAKLAHAIWQFYVEEF